MVAYNEQARADLESIFDGLLGWQTSNGQPYMDTEEVVSYHNDILDICESLGAVALHTKSKYPDHIKYGRYVYPYKRNAKTCWYIIYNIIGADIFVEKIMNNYLTVLPRP
jgi:hypothetical protein